MRKGRDGEWKMEKMENKGENSSPLTSLQVDRLTATDCNAAARANWRVTRIPGYNTFSIPAGPGEASAITVLSKTKCNNV